MELFRELNQQGTTIVQVTHSEANAAYGNRVIQLRDGWLVSDTANPIFSEHGRGGEFMMVRGPKASLQAKLLAGLLAFTNAFAFGQSASLPAAPSSTFKLEMPKSHNPLGAYIGTDVPASPMANSSRLNQLVRDGKLYISLQDAISLALENNLDLAIARYNLPIADTDVLRTRAGGIFRGVNTGVVQGTPGGGIGGLGAGAPGGGAGGTTAEPAAPVPVHRVLCSPRWAQVRLLILTIPN